MLPLYTTEAFRAVFDELSVKYLAPLRQMELKGCGYQGLEFTREAAKLFKLDGRVGWCKPRVAGGSMDVLICAPHKHVHAILDSRKKVEIWAMRATLSPHSKVFMDRPSSPMYHQHRSRSGSEQQRKPSPRQQIPHSPKGTSPPGSPGSRELKDPTYYDQFQPIGENWSDALDFVERHELHAQAAADPSAGPAASASTAPDPQRRQSRR